MSASITFKRPALTLALEEITAAAGPGDSTKPAESALVISIDENHRATIVGVSRERMIEARHSGALPDAAPGVYAVPRERFTQIVKVLTGEHVAVTFDGARAQVSSGSAAFTVPTVSGAAIEPASAPVTVLGTAAGSQLTTAIHQLRTAMPVARLNAAVQLRRVSASQLRLAATDGYRLTTVQLDAALPEEFSDVLLPYKAVTGGIDYLARKNSQVTLSLNDGVVGVTAGAASLKARQIDVGFPDVDTLLAGLTFSSSLTVARDEMLEVIDRVLVAAGDLPAITVEQIAGGQIRVALRSADTTQASDVCRVMQSSLVTPFAVNGRYLADALSAVSSNDVTIAINDATKPLRIRGTSGEYQTILMPLR